MNPSSCVTNFAFIIQDIDSYVLREDVVPIAIPQAQCSPEERQVRKNAQSDGGERHLQHQTPPLSTYKILAGGSKHNHHGEEQRRYMRLLRWIPACSIPFCAIGHPDASTHDAPCKMPGSSADVCCSGSSHTIPSRP